MAIPFNLPSDEQTEDNYRRLDQLLHDLYRVLRQILVRTSHSPEQPRNSDGEGAGAEVLAGAGAGEPTSAPSGSRQVVDVTGSRPLPDVVSSTLSCRCQRRRPVRRHRRRRRSSCAPLESPCPSPDVTQSLSPRPRPQQPENWVVIGEHLRRIAEEFKSSFRKEEESREQKDELKMEVKTSGLFSLLVPAHFRSSLWTTVILLVGWRLLVRAR
ncbi:uncharacterized protein LOC124360865 [Homalodisca vitripennis]|uniref:uncharacterized protein LOC124360865 n=1 Tax=Homalodisca vitripennis TaxID=197043 RepID=UPI001EEB45B9|nr:uncharacterized protein LOC124360865 [Homalodisca vitripennis]